MTNGEHQAYICNEPTSWKNGERHQVGCTCGTMLGWLTKNRRRTNPYTLTKDTEQPFAEQQFVGHYETPADAIGRAWAQHVGPFADEIAIAAETRSQGQTPPPAENPDAAAATETVKSPSAHTIAKFTAPKQGAVQVVSCTTCGVIGYVKNDGDGYITHADGNPGDIIPWTEGARGGIGRTIHVSGARDAKAHIQQWHLRDLEQLQSSTVLNDEPTAVPGAEPEQPTLDDEALIAQAILACANQIITAIDTAADQAFPHRRGRRDLAQVRILNATGGMLQQLARERGTQIARSQRASQAAVARALGVTRARVNQMLKEAD